MEKKNYDQAPYFYISEKSVKFKVNRLSGFQVIVVTDLKKRGFEKNAFKVLNIA